MKRPFYALAFAMPLLQMGTRAETYMITPVLETCLLAFFGLVIRQPGVANPEAGLDRCLVMLFLALASVQRSQRLRSGSGQRAARRPP